MSKFDFYNKNVTLIIKFAVLGGAERQALGMADYLIKNYNCKVSFITTQSNIQTEEFKKFAQNCGVNEILFFGIPYLSSSSKWSLSAFKKNIRTRKYLSKMKVEVSKLKPHIIIPFLNSPSKIAALIYKETGAKITFWHHLGLDSYINDNLEKKAIQKTPFIIANGPDGLSVFRNQFKIKEEKLYYLPQYVSIKKIDYDNLETKKEFQIAEKTLVIGMIAHYRPEKYFGLLIEAFSKIANLYDIHLVLLGNKDNNSETLAIFENLNNQVGTYHLEKKVSLLSGFPVEKILSLVNIGVLVSEIEGTPNVILEYMLYGKPIIASNHEGCKKLMGESEFLIPNDVNILVEKLKVLIESEQIRNKEATKNEENIKTFKIESYFENLTEILNNNLS